MTGLRAYYSPAYAVEGVQNLERLALAAKLIEDERLARIQAPRSFDISLLDGLHDERYVKAFMAGDEPLASSQGIPWSPAVRDASLAMLGGQIEGARHALEHGIAMNVARGFHHAVRARGAGFCALNGLALIAHAMPRIRVLVLDCDEHGGNGTEEYAAELPNLYNVSIFGTRFGCRGGTRSWAFQVRVAEDGYAKYLQALGAAAQLVAEHRPDLIVYQAGVDCHERDPKSLLRLSTAQLVERDRLVFRLARDSAIPLLFVVAGGYQHSEQVARLNANTVRVARDIYGKSP